MQSLKLEMRTVTPVSVGGDKGQQLSPYADYIFSRDGKNLLYLNLRKLENAVMDAEPGTLDEYIRLIRAAMNNNRSDFSLDNFVSGRLKGNIERDFTARVVPQFGLGAGQRVPVVPMVKNAGSPYIPGSSIKGALRTAMLYDWLVNTKAGEPELKTAADNVTALYKRHQDYFKSKSLKFLAPNERYLKREFDKDLRNAEKEIFNETKLFGSIKSKTGPDARFIQVSDTQPVDKLEVHALRRIRIAPGQGKSTIPQIMEALPANTRLNFTLSIAPGLKNEVLGYWNKGSFDAIFSNLKSFSNACIENELYDLRDALEVAADQGERIGFEREIEHLIEFYEGLQERAANGEILLRLGFGKTVNDNSLILALLNGVESNRAWHDFRAVFHKIRRESAYFPVTRAITPKGQPMGWVTINVK